jgi:S-adenosylmethionine:tRNA ribosyltransferase-isomerase
LTLDRQYGLSDFDYELPPELIAQTPIEERSASRLLVVRRAARPAGGRPVFEDLIFSDLLSLIPAGDLVVLNTSRVRHARLVGRRPSGATAEVLLIRPAGDGTWLALGKPGSALQPGKRIQIEAAAWVETVEVLADGHRRVRIVGTTAEEAMQRLGRVPLPPYITREPVPSDAVRYQTVYAKREGSVAAPTAGLHFTDELLDALSAKGVVIAGLDLEVGPGTFKPVETEPIEHHQMHPERYDVPDRVAGLAGEVRRRGGRIWAVGTTVVRALESASDAQGVVRAGPGETSLLILPGYRFRVVERLITNFHLPRSTLLMLVSAFAGHDTMHAAYTHAVQKRYRFYSYGDAMVVI